MTGDYDFRGGTHSHCVCTGRLEPAVLGHGLIARPCDREIYAFVQLDSQFPGLFLRQGNEFRVVRPGHIRETLSERVQIRTYERVRDEVDVVVYYHKVSDLEALHHTSGRIRDEKSANAEPAHHPDRESDRIHRVTLIVVEASLHRNDLLPGQSAYDEIAFVAYGCRLWKARDVGVRDDSRVAYLLRYVSEAAAQDYAEFRLASAHRIPYECRRFVDTYLSLVHNFYVKTREHQHLTCILQESEGLR